MTESRETVASKLLDDQQRLSYDDKDSQRITDASGVVARDVVSLIAAIGNYDRELASPIDEDADSRMRYARKTVVENFAFAQVALAKLGAVFRIDGDEAFKRMVEFLDGDEEASLDMTGL